MVDDVGRLQFEVLQDRLKRDYLVDTILEPLPYEYGVWISGDRDSFVKPSRAMLARDSENRLVGLFRSEVEKDYCASQNPNHQFLRFQC